MVIYKSWHFQHEKCLAELDELVTIHLESYSSFADKTAQNVLYALPTFIAYFSALITNFH